MAAQPLRGRRAAARAHRGAARGGEAAGRGPLPVTLQLAPTEPAELERFEAAGVTRAVWYLPPAGLDKVEPAFDRYAAVVAAYAGTT